MAIPEEKKKVLPTDVAAKYEMEGNHLVGEYHYQGHIVHLGKISVKYADQLVEQGFPYLVAKKAEKVAKMPD